MNFFEKSLSYFAPGLALKRAKARLHFDYIASRSFDAAKKGNSTKGWLIPKNSERQDIALANEDIRARAQDLVQNNPIASQAVETIANYVVGPFGFKCKFKHKSTKVKEDINTKWKQWAETTDCDADGHLDFAGLQRLIQTEVVQKGSVLVRYRRRRAEDGLPVPLQLQVLDIAHLDKDKEQPASKGKNKILNGIEFDAKGKRVAYWVFPEHPLEVSGQNSNRIKAEEIRHIFRKDGATYIDGVSWFHSILLRMKDFDDYLTNEVIRKKLSSCFTVFIENSMPDVDDSPLGSSEGSGGVEDDVAPSLGPGYVHELEPGQKIQQAEPGQVGDMGVFATWMCRLFATGLGITYEMLIQDLTGVNYSSARVGHNKAIRNIKTWQRQIMKLQFCDPTLKQFLEAYYLVSGNALDKIQWDWVTPTVDLIDPEKTAKAAELEVKNGFKTHSQVVMEYGNDPEDHYKAMAEDNKKLAKHSILLACSTQGGPSESQND